MQSTGLGCMLSKLCSLWPGGDMLICSMQLISAELPPATLTQRPTAHAESFLTVVSSRAAGNAPAASAAPWATGAADPPETLRSCSGVSASTARGVPAPQKSTESPEASSAEAPSCRVVAGRPEGPPRASGLMAPSWRPSSPSLGLPVGTGELLAATKPESTRTRTGVA